MLHFTVQTRNATKRIATLNAMTYNSLRAMAVGLPFGTYKKADLIDKLLRVEFPQSVIQAAKH